MTKITRGSAFLICAILGVALLIGAVFEFRTASISTPHIEAAMTSYSSAAVTGASTNGDPTSARVYIYCDNTYIGSASISTSTISTSRPSSYAQYLVNYTWTGRFTMTLRSGYTWIASSLTGKFAWGNGSEDSEEEAYSSALSRAGSASTSTITRSGNSFTISGAELVGTAGGRTGLDYLAGVLRIDNINDYIGYSIIANAENSGSDKVQIDKTSDNYIVNSGNQHTFEFTSVNSSYINDLTINNVGGLAISPSSTVPASFAQTTGCQYKAYRSANNQVTVIVTALTQNTTITVNNDVITPSITNGSGTTATVATTTANGYPQWVYTFTSYTNYYINTLNVGGTTISFIPESDPGDFTTNGNCQFKCYRSNNQVIVIVNALYNNTNIVGTYATLWTVSSNKASLTISQQDTTQTREHYFSDFPVQISATFTNDQNFYMLLDGIKTTFKGSYCTGSVAVGNGTIDYSYSKEADNIVINLSNVTYGPHNVVLDYDIGLEYNVSASIQSPGRGTVDVYMDDDGLYNILVTPATGSYVHAMIFNDVSVVIDYYKAEVYGVAAAETVTYVAKDSTNVFLLKFDKIYGDTTVIFSLINSKPTYRIPPSSSGGSVGVSGTLVTAGLGGEARMVGFDYSATDNESIHFVAVAYSGYKFAGWSVDGQILEDYSSIADIPYDLVKDKVVTAVFEPKDTDSAHNGSLHDPNHGADIL